jgi:hypothetical protein
MCSAPKEAAIIGALAEGFSTRSIERITGVHRDTICGLAFASGRDAQEPSSRRSRELAQQKRVRKVGRPKLPKGEAMGRIVPVRFTGEDMLALALVTAATNQTISKWVRSVVRKSFRWVVECKHCGKEFLFRLIDQDHPRETVNNMPEVEPPKPALRNLAEERVCPQCNRAAIYKRADLQFRAN